MAAALRLLYKNQKCQLWNPARNERQSLPAM
jgi:hypothetical protein